MARHVDDNWREDIKAVKKEIQTQMNQSIRMAYTDEKIAALREKLANQQKSPKYSGYLKYYTQKHIKNHIAAALPQILTSPQIATAPAPAPAKKAVEFETA